MLSKGGEVQGDSRGAYKIKTVIQGEWVARALWGQVVLCASEVLPRRQAMPRDA